MPRLIRARSPRRAGFSLAEVMVVLLILSLVGSAMFRVLVKQQQSYSDSSKQSAMQREIRLTSSFVPSEFRATSSAGGDVIVMNEDQVEFLANTGSAVICGKQGNTHFYAPPLNAAGVTMTNWYTQPLAGDVVFMYNDSLLKGAEDDVWTQATLVSVDNNTGGLCSGTPYTHPTQDAGKLRWRFGVGGGIPDSVRVGAVVRFARPVRYRAFSAASGKWYLGFQEYVNGNWTQIEAVGGPFRPFVANDAPTSGIQLRYFDSLGVRLTNVADRKRVSRIDVYLRTDAGEASVTERKKNITDSVMMRIAVRNFK
jgi:prepilin-type N-terminal cleavage/methylation domain-containing protein